MCLNLQGLFYRSSMSSMLYEYYKNIKYASVMNCMKFCNITNTFGIDLAVISWKDLRHRRNTIAAPTHI